MAFNYPLARRDEDVIDDYHGTKVSDPYRWLENPDSEETAAYVEELNKISRPYMDSCSVKEQIRARYTELWNYPKYSCPRKEGDHYFYYYNTGLQNQSVLYIQKDLKDEGKIFLDPNLLAADGTTSLNTTAYSDNGKFFAYGLSEKGSDWVTIKFKTIPEGTDLPDTLSNVKFTSLAWTKNNQGLFYNQYPKSKADSSGKTTDKNEFQQLWYHKLGTDQSADILCHELPDDPSFFISAEVSEDGAYLIVKVDKGCDPTNLLYWYDLKAVNEQISDRLQLEPLIDTFEAKYEFICNTGPVFTLMTNADAPMFKLIQVDIREPSKKHWVLVEENSKAKLDWAKLVHHDKLILCYMEDVKDVLYVHNWKGGERLYKIPLDIGSVTGVSGKEKLSTVFFGFQSFLVPTVIYQLEITETLGELKVFRQTVVNGFDPSQFVSRQVFFSSKDGTKVPMFLVHGKNLALNGENPTLLYGYGGFNISLSPSFRLSALLFVQHFGGVYAMANLRGGAEYGEKWHEAGMKDRKQNVFDDFIAAAEYLISEKVTNPTKLAIQGGSNGGTLVAACMQQRPELFRAVINQVGVMDMLRFSEFTIGAAWTPEFGHPVKVKEDFDNIIKYSPLHNLKSPSDHEYPCTLLLTADHDDRVVPLHSLKYIAQMYHCIRDSPLQVNPVLIRVETKAGHGGGKPTAKVIDEMTDIYAFLCNALDLKWQ